jgi:hypothetical protein
MESKVIAVAWKTGRECIGIVAVDTGFGIKGYIKKVEGMDQDSDITQIAEWGTRLEVSELEGFFPNRLEEFRLIGYSN